METKYYDITNSHPSDNVTVTVEASVLAITSGSQSCELTIGSSTVNLTYEAVDVTGPVSHYLKHRKNCHCSLVSPIWAG